jgi:hypothetical protein
MQSDSDISGLLLKAIVILAALATLYAGWEVLPFYLSNTVFERDVRSQARLFGRHEEYSAALQNAIYRDAQRRSLPVQPDDIQVEYDPSGPRVDVNYTVTADLGVIQLPLHFHPHYPRPKQTFPPPERAFFGGIGFILGLYWFFKGFGTFREYKVIADTPLVPIRSVAMGRVQIHGRAIGEKRLQSPVSNQPCFLYKVDIDRFLAGRQGRAAGVLISRTVARSDFIWRMTPERCWLTPRAPTWKSKKLTSVKSAARKLCHSTSRGVRMRRPQPLRESRRRIQNCEGTSRGWPKESIPLPFRVPTSIPHSRRGRGNGSSAAGLTRRKVFFAILFRRSGLAR